MRPRKTPATTSARRGPASKAPVPKPSAKPARTPSKDAVAPARAALLSGVGAEVAASFPGITRIGGQIVAALYLDDQPESDHPDGRDPNGARGVSMDALAAEIGCSKSNVFMNLRALEAASIVARHRIAGERSERFFLRGPYPDVMIGAYASRLRRMVSDKRALVARARGLLGDARGADADRLRNKLDELGRKYDLFAVAFDRVGHTVEGPIDLEALLRALPPDLLDLIDTVAGGIRGTR